MGISLFPNKQTTPLRDEELSVIHEEKGFCPQGLYQNKKHPFEVLFAFFGGPERIRTAVEAFAELCLATRPQDPFRMRK